MYDDGKTSDSKAGRDDIEKKKIQPFALFMLGFLELGLVCADLIKLGANSNIICACTSTCSPQLGVPLVVMASISSRRLQKELKEITTEGCPVGM